MDGDPSVSKRTILVADAAEDGRIRINLSNAETTGRERTSRVQEKWN